MKENAKEAEDSKMKAIKSHLKKKKEAKKEKKIPEYEKEREYERGLKITALEGITKVFNVLNEMQEKYLHTAQEIVEERKDKNYWKKGRKKRGPKTKEKEKGKFLQKNLNFD